MMISNKHRKRLAWIRSRAAFSLLEILIVVAIIAILAAIMVPNFLDAQTRAKIARAKSDVRVVAEAIEAYRVDTKQYPWPDDAQGNPILNMDNLPHAFTTRIPVRLTTPTAYLTHLLVDPFPNRDKSENSLFLYAPRNYFEMAEGEGAFDSYTAMLLPYEASSGLRYSFRVLSRGPDLDAETAAPAVYDPSNGTVSSGDIVRFGPGGSFAR